MAILRRPQFGWTLNWAAFFRLSGYYVMLLMFSVQIIMSGMTSDSVPFVIPNDERTGHVWPLFADKESAACFLELAKKNAGVLRLHQ